MSSSHGFPSSVARTAALLLEHLRISDPVAWELLCFHGFLGPSRVPFNLVNHQWRAIGPAVREAGRRIQGSSKQRALALLNPLFEHSCLQRLINTEDYCVRPVIGRMVLANLCGSECLSAFEHAVMAVWRETQHSDSMLDRHLLVPHARRLIDFGSKAGALFPELSDLASRIRLPV